MNDKCGICLYWEYMGMFGDYDDDEGFCYLKVRRMKQDEVCNKYEIDPLLSNPEVSF